MLFSGIDLHKRSVAIHTLDAEGTVVRAANLPTQRGALMAYFGTLPGRAPCGGRVHRHVVPARRGAQPGLRQEFRRLPDLEGAVRRRGKAWVLDLCELMRPARLTDALERPHA